MPAPTAAAIAPGLPVARRLRPYLDRDRDHYGGAVVVFLGVPEDEVAGQRFTHHQLLQDYDQPLGDGNNMFVSVSAPGDTVSAPAGTPGRDDLHPHRSRPTGTGLDESEYAQRKKEIGERLIGYARRVYPTLGDRAVVVDVGTPRTYERFGFRPGRRGRRRAPDAAQRQPVRDPARPRRPRRVAGRRLDLARTRHGRLRAGQPHRGRGRAARTAEDVTSR